MSEKFEGREELKTMHCESSDRLEGELKAEGWEEFFSFHIHISEQWNMACEKVDEAVKYSDWEVVVTNKQDKRDETVSVLYRRKTEQRKKWDKGQGYK